MKFEVLMIVPPWNLFRTYSRSYFHLTDRIPGKMFRATAAFGFLEECLRTMSKPDHVVLVWVRDRYLEDCKYYFNSLGYRYDRLFIWTGPRKSKGSKRSCEYLLQFQKGAGIIARMPAPEPSSIVFSGSAGKRKGKPDQAYAIVETRYPACAKIQLFGNLRRPGCHHLSFTASSLSI
jgi:N6-adenosine-specific RNA methylase IME4